MDLVHMRSKLLEALGFLSGDITDEDLDFELNRAYRFIIPNRIDGAAVRELLPLALSAGVDAYDVDGSGIFSKPVRFVRRIAYYNDQPLDVYTVPELFWDDWKVSGTETGAPQALLIEGRKITVRPKPATSYTVYVGVARYRDALTSGGVSDDEEALAVVHAACGAHAHDNAMEDTATRADAHFEAALSNLSAKYRGNTDAMPAVVQDF